MVVKNNQKTPANFEVALRELEQITEQMENGALPLDASLQAYQRGAFLVKYCQSQLQAVQEQVKIVEAGLATPFDLNGNQSDRQRLLPDEANEGT